MKEKVAIILVNFNGKKYLPDCLSSLANLDYPKDNLKIFFIDNGSSDDSLEYAKNNYKDFEYVINGKNLGFAEGNNVGIKKAIDLGFDFAYLINQDTISEPDSLKKLVYVMQNNENIAAVQPRLMLWPEKDKVNSLGNSIHYLGFGFSGGGYQKFSGDLTPQEIAYPSGAAVLIKTEVLKKIGSFDAKLFAYHEDLDLGWRMRLAGYKILVAPDAVVYHKYEFSRSIGKYYFMERNRFICLLENYKLGTLILIFPALLFMEIGLFVYSIFSGFWLQKLKVYGYFLRQRNWQEIIRERRERRAIRVRRDREVIKLFTGKIEFQEIDNFILKYAVNPLFNFYFNILKFLVRW
ncbi:glycosyltransferase family 2 protein [Candidatus Falkowbacteria bacterium]|nr:glycosyltransferase family 2 protein [Candidatus Falkowbacteria bacterium]